MNLDLMDIKILRHQEVKTKDHGSSLKILES